jgi:hypothetical protein
MSTILLPYVFSPGTVILSAQVNSNFATFIVDYDGNITDANLAAGAAVQESKILFAATGHQHGGGANGAPIKLAQGGDLTAAATMTPGTDGNYFNVNGAATVSSLGTRPAQTLAIFNLVSGCSFTFNAVSLQLASGADFAGAAGDLIAFLSLGGGNWRELWRASHSSATGVPLGLIYGQFVTQAAQPVPFL